MRAAFRSAAATALALGALYGSTASAGLVLLCLVFATGVLSGVEILFYRGLALIAFVAFAIYATLLAVLRRWPVAGLGTRDVFAAAVLSMSFNVAFLVLVPVTVDRSISLFVLARMADRPQASFTAGAMSGLFSRVYVDERHQIDRRLHEQELSGNVVKTGEGYRITPRGVAIIAVARLTARLFDSRAGLVAPAPPSLATADGPR